MTAGRSDVSRSGKPAVVAHRGASGENAEHTLLAYEQALEQGADGLECDVRLTADGELVCIHDRTIERVSDGTGAVSEMTLAELQEHDFGSWHSGTPAQVLTLDQLMELTLDWRRPIRLFIETKHPVRYGAQVEQRVLETLQRFHVAAPPSADHSRAVVISFSPSGVWRIRRSAPMLPTILLGDTILAIGSGPATAVGATGVGPSVRILREHPDLVDKAAAAGRVTYCWTVDNREDVQLCADLGVRWIATNHPGRTRDWLVTVD
ncbi:MAG: glycerophosphodiester phosphodiesterase [Gordonia sp. (in: high G+C Gram-positive bacteria)]|uniref:glycerophosphodiester phosphodiesterase n=1 Tax=Gordonia sp. (in: high G+C Gram-positive bacteria) TaxID=84139 RepID=UPI0039E45E9D